MKLLLEQLQLVREEIRVKKEFLDEANERKKEIEILIMEAMNSQELKSARYDTITATIAERSTLKVVDEKVVVKYLKEKHLTDYISERPNDLFNVFVKQAQSQNMEVPGMEMQNTTYLSIRNNKKGE